MASDNKMLSYKRTWKTFIRKKWREEPYRVYEIMIAFFMLRY